MANLRKLILALYLALVGCAPTLAAGQIHLEQGLGAYRVAVETIVTEVEACPACVDLDEFAAAVETARDAYDSAVAAKEALESVHPVLIDAHERVRKALQEVPQ